MMTLENIVSTGLDNQLLSQIREIAKNVDILYLASKVVGFIKSRITKNKGIEYAELETHLRDFFKKKTGNDASTIEIILAALFAQYAIKNVDKLEQEILGFLHQNYQIKNEAEVIEFLWTNEDIAEKLLKIPTEAKKVFSNMQHITLEHKYWCDEPGEYLSVTIHSTDGPRESVNLLKEFDKNWWIPNYTNNLIIKV